MQFRIARRWCSMLFMLFLAVVCLAAPRSVGATQYLFTATPLSSLDDLSSFSFVYTDKAPFDDKVSLDEIDLTTFSGMTLTLHPDPDFPLPFVTFAEITRVPVLSPESPLTNGDYRILVLLTSSSAPEIPAFQVLPGAWTYTQTAVPLPGAVLLLGAGLMRLAAHARRQKRLG